jgi:hypothetical protein
MLFIKRVLGQVAVEASDTPLLSGLFETFNLRLVFINDLSGSYLVDLMQVTYSALHNLDQDQSLDNGVAGCADVQISHVCLR